jgi:tRNA A37 threonylcarbamoyladenosine biosynthesis protein TsaE
LLDFAGGEGVVLVEWAERVRGLLPPEYLLVELAVAGATRRQLRFSACGQHHAAVLVALGETASEDRHASRH